VRERPVTKTHDSRTLPGRRSTGSRTGGVSGGAPAAADTDQDASLRDPEARARSEKLLEETSRQEFAGAVTEGSTEAFPTKVYPLEHAFEILVNLVVELAELGLQLPEIVPDGSSAKVLKQLEAERSSGTADREVSNGRDRSLAGITSLA
jgi:hypothetical protein